MSLFHTDYHTGLGQRSSNAGSFLGPAAEGEDDFSLLSRLGYYHDDRYGEDCYGWVCSGDVGWPADHLGGRIFQPLSSSQLDAAWAHRMWRRALQSVLAILMGPSGSARLALRSAERLRHEAFCLLLRERRISRNARSLPGMNRERHQPLANAEAAYLRAARHAEECRHRCRQAQWVGTTSRAPTGGRVLEGVIKLPRSPPQARKFWRY